MKPPSRLRAQASALLLACALACLTAALPAHAHNVQVTSHGITSADDVNQFAMVSFDLSWDNSWRDALNHDGVWVFVKWRTVGSSGAWQHASLHYVDGTSDGHTAPAGAAITTPSDGKGVFVHRSADGAGNVSFANCGLRWDYGVDGLSSTDEVDLKVFAVEMVYVPEGPFWLGDGDSTQVFGHFTAGNSNAPYQVTGEGPLTLGGGTPGSVGNHDRLNTYTHPACTDGCLPGSGDDFDNSTSQLLPTEFPKGFAAFWCMKHEVTQQQMVDMLNCVTATQQAMIADTAHYYNWTGPYMVRRWGIRLVGGEYVTTEPYLPIIYCDWVRAAAYADWCGLRPMTELEYEKAARGPSAPVVGEYPWGTAGIDLSANLTVSGASLPSEGVASGYGTTGTNGNAWINGGAHNMETVARVGIFAAHPSNTGRVTSGGTYWGIMDMGGNAWERAVSVGHTEGRKFTGMHGDGALNAAGYADIGSWPGSFSSGYVDTNIGMGYRGGGLAYPTPDLETNARISSRRLASGYYNTVIHDDGFRLVRTAE